MSSRNENLDKGKVKITSLVSFLMGFSQAMLIYVMAYYFKLASGTENVGPFYFISFGIILIIFLNLHKLIRALGKSNVFYFSILATVVISSLLVFLEPSYLGIALLMTYVIFINIAWTSLDVILESFSTDRMSGRIRGAHLTIVNFGYLLGPFLSTRILGKFDFKGIFLFLLVFNALVLVVSLLGLRDVNHRFDVKLKALDLIKKFLRRKELMKIYYISFCLDFFYALVVIYTSIYLLDRGISWEKIGIIFTIMLIPFVIFQYPIGFLADKKMGEKELLVFALAVMGISTGIVYFIDSSSVLVWAIVLFCTRIGASMVEILRDSYFYKKIDGHDVDVINFFRTTMPAGYILATVVSFALLMIFPTKIVFLVAAAVAFSGLYPAFRLIDSKSERESIL
ncbi:MAG: MFS transporter [bacterium]|nr:MFS transporter [bacterium]